MAMREVNNTIWVAPMSTKIAVGSIDSQGRLASEKRGIESESKEASSSGSSSRVVACYNPLDGEYLKKFSDSISAGKNLGLSIEKIDIALKSRQNVYAGLKWYYIERSDAPMGSKTKSYIQKILQKADWIARNASTEPSEISDAELSGWCFSVEDDPSGLVGQHVLR